MSDLAYSPSATQSGIPGLAQEVQQMSQVLENLGTNVLVADRNRTLIYMNARSKETLEGMEDDLEQQFGLNSSDLLNGSIDRLHGTSAKRIARLLSDAKNLPHKAEIKVGQKLLSLEVNAMTNTQGEFIGLVVNWDDVTDKKRLQESMTRIQNMVENAPVNIMMADKSLNLTYLNPKSKETLKKLEQYLPAKVDTLLGKSIDIFHKNPAFQRGILGNPANLPRQAIIGLGPEKLDLLVSAITDEKGEYIGPMVTWSLVTEKLNLENSAQRIQNMVENAPVNIMMADRDLNLTYMNPKSKETLKKLEQYLPVKVDQLLGKSIDILHKNPAYQRGILANPANLPRQAMIKVGPESLDLLVSAITDKNGQYIGPMVTWSIVTEKLALENAAQRIQNMVENAPVNIMMADRDLNLTYLNPKSRETLKKLEQYLPVKVDQLLGKSIDILHKNPSYQRGILANPANLPRQATIKLGPESLDLLVSAITDKNGQYIGPMVTWSIVTEKLALENSAQRIQNMVENSPVNIMMADRDLNLTYLNPKSKETLKKLEQYLPVKVEQLLGKSIDILHKNPSYQRGILANPANLPRQAMIKLGPETLDLLVSAITDKNGEYIGPMVTWSIVTEKLALENQSARVTNMVDKANINILMADTDLKISYMNQASLNTLRKLQQYFPIPAERTVGQSVDIFHKNPAYQRQILSNPANLPHHAEIQLGPEWLELNVAAIMDKAGNYIGPMVTWAVVTDEKRARERDVQVREQIVGITKDLGASAGDMVNGSNTMAANAEENSSQATNVSSAAEQVSANVSSVAAAVEEMSATIQEVSKTVVKSSEVTQKAVSMAKQASAMIAQMGESSKEISQVTKVIANIAQQTNILALNATIEAARAGDAGKGFAVVANEVKELAKSTSKMTEDISTRVSGMQQSTTQAVSAIEEINRIMGEVDSLSSTVASAVEEQSATTNEISRSMTEASTGVNEIVRNITGMAEAAKDTSQQAIKTKESAEGLGGISQRLTQITAMFERK